MLGISFFGDGKQPESLPLPFFLFCIPKKILKRIHFVPINMPINILQEMARRGRTKAKAKTKARRKAPGVAWRTSQKRRSQGGREAMPPTGSDVATWGQKDQKDD